MMSVPSRPAASEDQASLFRSGRLQTTQKVAGHPQQACRLYEQSPTEQKKREAEDANQTSQHISSMELTKPKIEDRYVHD